MPNDPKAVVSAALRAGRPEQRKSVGGVMATESRAGWIIAGIDLSHFLILKSLPSDMLPAEVLGSVSSQLLLLNP